VSCYVELGWGPKLQNLTSEATRFQTEHGFEEWTWGRDGQLILKAEVDQAQAARLVRDFYVRVMRSLGVWPVPTLRSYSVVNPLASWFLVVTEKAWRSEDAFSRCIAVDEPLLYHVGVAPPQFDPPGDSGMCIWRHTAEPVTSQTLFAMEQARTSEEPLFSPEGDAPDFFTIEEL
jgi:hypothetical protein